MTRTEITDLSNILGFPLSVEYFGNVRASGKTRRIGPSGVRAIRILVGICSTGTASSNVYWGVNLRPQIRRVSAIDCSQGHNSGVKTALNLVVRLTTDDEVRRVAIWLRGRCGGTFGADCTSRFRTHPDWRMRKEVARALSRMSAWHALREMSRDDLNPRVRNFASQNPPKRMSNRIDRFTRHWDRSTSTGATLELFVDPSVDFGVVARPKSIELIRFYLKRIRNTLAGIIK